MQSSQGENCIATHQDEMIFFFFSAKASLLFFTYYQKLTQIVEQAGMEGEILSLPVGKAAMEGQDSKA